MQEKASCEKRLGHWKPSKWYQLGEGKCQAPQPLEDLAVIVDEIEKTRKNKKQSVKEKSDFLWSVAQAFVDELEDFPAKTKIPSDADLPRAYRLIAAALGQKLEEGKFPFAEFEFLPSGDFVETVRAAMKVVASHRQAQQQAIPKYSKWTAWLRSDPSGAAPSKVCRRNYTPASCARVNYCEESETGECRLGLDSEKRDLFLEDMSFACAEEDVPRIRVALMNLGLGGFVPWRSSDPLELEIELSKEKDPGSLCRELLLAVRFARTGATGHCL